MRQVPVPVNWWARAALAEDFARRRLAAAHDQDPDSPDLPRAFPREFAELVHVWSLAHPPAPPVGGGWTWDASGIRRLPPPPDHRVTCAACAERVYPEDLERAEGDHGAWTDMCRRCAAKGRETADGGR